MIDITKLIPPSKSLDECYKAGFDAAVNGANTDNCHFAFFSSREKTTRWEEGNKNGRAHVEAAEES